MLICISVSGVPSNISGNATVLSDVLTYHVVQGNFSTQTASFPNVTVGRTLLNDSAVVSLEGNKSQVLAWSKMSDGKIQILNQM